MKQLHREITVEESKQIQVSLLKKVHNFCEANNLTYFLMYGTLLGAVRHKGFIPWDDDVDICMPRSDYKKFFDTFQCIDAKAVDCDTEKTYYLPFGKVYDTRTILRENILNAPEIGVYIDIFPVDWLSSNENINTFVRRRIVFLRDVLSIRFLPNSQKRSRYRQFIHAFLNMLPLKINMNKCSRKISKLSQSLDDGTKNKCAIISNIDRNDIALAYNGSYFEKRSLLPFCGENVWVPLEHDPLLRCIYGDYMTFPPIEDQVTHHEYSAHWI